MLLLNILCSFVEGEYGVLVLCLVLLVWKLALLDFLLLFDVIGLCT